MTARRLQQEIGGEIVFFYHDSDHDPRETMTVLRDRQSGEEVRINFGFRNKLQKKYTPLFAKELDSDWQKKTLRQLPCYVEQPLVNVFAEVRAVNVADFCLEMYARLGLLAGIRVVRSGDPSVRLSAGTIADFFVDVHHEGELVRARWVEGRPRLHAGGDCWIDLPCQAPTKACISPTRDTRMSWMQSVIGCSHYIAGAGEMAYLNTAEFPDVTFVPRDFIEDSAHAFTDYT